MIDRSTPKSLRLVVARDAGDLANLAADVVEDHLRASKAPVLGLATGGSVAGLYGELVRRHRQGTLRFAGVRAFLLDEYIGLPADHSQAYRNVIRTVLTDHVDLPPGAVRSPDAWAADLLAECARYDRMLADSVGLQILGIGRNGHIAFNEPGSSLSGRTRPVVIAEQTRCDNARFFDHAREVPQRALTQGIGTILRASQLLLLAQGAAKAAAVCAALEGPVTAALPASALQLHSHVTVVADLLAASQLSDRTLDCG